MASAFVLALSKDLRHLVALLIWISYILPKVYPTTLPLPYYYLTTTLLLSYHYLTTTLLHFRVKCLFLNSLDSFHRVKLNCLSTSFTSY
jgi:hypothetical protein